MSLVLIGDVSRAVSLSGRTGNRPGARSNASLVRELVRAWDDDLFHVLVQRHKDRVFRLAASVLGPGNEAEAEDVTQEVFVLVYRKFETFRHESDFSTWLFRMTKNRAIDRRRQARHRHPHVGEEALRTVPATGRSSNPERVAAAGERRARILEHVEKLPDPQRTVVYLYYWTGEGVAEIAELLDMNVQTVKSQLHRARRRLAQELRPVGSDHA